MIAPPRQLVLETSGACQLSCPQCWKGLHWTNRNAFMSRELFNRIADEAQDFITHTYLHLWGEPTLNRDLPAMIQRVKEFSTIDLATHGLGLDDHMIDAIATCDTISVSIDGITQEVYERYRVGGVYSEALTGLRRLAEKAKHLTWVFVVFKHNEHQITDAQHMADDLGVKIHFKPAAFWDKSAMDRDMPTEDKYRRFQILDDQWQLKADRLTCREFWITAYVLPTGDMITCCYDGAAEYVVGNVKDQGILEVWNGERYNEMRSRHSAGTLNEMCSKYCQWMAA